MLVGKGDAYSTGGAEEFLKEASSRNIDVCTRAEYVHLSQDMSAAMKKIIDNRCCTVTVVFGQRTDLAPLFVEAYHQNYAGEWFVGDAVVGVIDILMQDMQSISRRKGRGMSHSQVQEALRGMFTCDGG